MLIRNYLLRGSKTEKLVVGTLFLLAVSAVTGTYFLKKSDLMDSYGKYTSDLTTAIEDMTSKVSLLSKLGVLQAQMKNGNKRSAQALLNKAIANEDNISYLYLVDNFNKVFATNTQDSGGMNLGEDSTIQRTNWEMVASREVISNKFGEFGYFRNKQLRIVYLSKTITEGDKVLGSLTAIFRYGELIDSLKIKHGFPLGAKVFLVNDTAALGSSYTCIGIGQSLDGYSVCYKLTLWETIKWAKWSLIIGAFVSALVCGLIFTIFVLINQKLVLPNEYFNAVLKRLDNDQTDKEGLEAIPVPKELIPVLPRLQAIMHSVMRASSGDMARQVAHDIRSPLAALNVVLSTVGKLDEETRLLVRHSITRIQDIANNLLEQSRSGSEALKEKTKKRDVHLVSSLIDGIVTEKRTQYRERIGIEITHKQCEASYGIFCEVVPSEFKRVLSNLVNNSVEATTKDGAITISTEIERSFAKIEVRDTGKGLSKEDIAKIGMRGFTVKAEGSGLGLSHAYKTIESWGGKITFDSERGVGTTVTIFLPLSESPEWFVGKLKVRQGMTIGILDDDSSIHQIWDKRLQSVGVQVEHFSTPDQLSQWLAENRDVPTRFLIDYELIGSSESGLDFIAKFGISSHSILVTSRFEEEAIRRKCAKLHVPLIPKGLAGFIPINSIDNLDAVLIDNEVLVHEAWKFRAELAGKNILCFKNSKEFFSALPAISEQTPVYVDMNLEDENGLEVTRKVCEAGFAEVFLATGANCSEVNLESASYLKGVLGKEPPWAGATV